jgi:hypothetical protein
MFFLSILKKYLLDGKFFPVFGSSAGMRDDNGASDNISHGEYFVQLFRGDPELMTFAEVIFNAIVAAQHHAGYQAKHFLGLFIKRTIFIGISVEVPQPFHYQVILAQYHFVHPRPVVIEIIHQFAHDFLFLQKYGAGAHGSWFIVHAWLIVHEFLEW